MKTRKPNQNPSSPALPKRLVHKDKPNDDHFSVQGSKFLYTLFIDWDTGYSFIEASPANRKTEINPIGYWVRSFNSEFEAQRLKRRIDRRPYLAAQILSIH
jgi:hypothetical protein